LKKVLADNQKQESILRMVAIDARGCFDTHFDTLRLLQQAQQPRLRGRAGV